MSTNPSNPTLRLAPDGGLDPGALADEPGGQDLLDQDRLVDELLRRAQARLNSWDKPVSKSWPCGAGLERITGMSAEYALLAQALDKERTRNKQLKASMAKAYAPKFPLRAI